jgi:glycosyltransferase involved in cell wall biosynthesis
MRVIIVCQNVIREDGHGRANYEVALEAHRRGHEVLMIADRVTPGLFENAGVRWLHVPVSHLRVQMIQDLVFSWRASNILREERRPGDIVFATGFGTWEPTDVCMVQFVHDAWRRSPMHTGRIHHGPYAWYHLMYSAVHTLLERHAFDRTRMLVAVSNQVRDTLLELGIEEGRIRLILNGVDADIFRPGEEDRVGLGLPEGVPLAFFSGDIRTPRKNLDSVLRALARTEGVHLAVAGTLAGSPYPALAAELGVQDRVHFLDFRRDMDVLMRASDFFVFPSRYEPFGLVVTEAMATGIPVITARTTGAAEVVGTEGGIVLDDPDDVKGLSEAMQLLADAPDLRHRMGTAAHKLALEHTWHLKAEAYLDLFEELVGLQTGPRAAERSLSL